MNFDSTNIRELHSGASQFNAANFGIVKMDHDGNVTDYNSSQERFTGMSKASVMGKHFFSQVAPCTNNFMVAQKYDNQSSLDEKVPYTFTLKMTPTPVTLRLLKDSSAQYLLCDWS